MRTQHTRGQFFFWPIFLALICALAASADTIRLKNGRVIKGEVVRFGNGEFVVRLPAKDAHPDHQDRMILLVGAVESIEFETATSVSEPAPKKEGVTLFGDVDYQGTSEVFYESDANLRDNRIGNDRASSIRVPRGYVVTLYEHADFQGRSVVLRSDEARLGNTAIGNDAVSSIRVEGVGP
jgi:hypothetical protein